MMLDRRKWLSGAALAGLAGMAEPALAAATKVFAPAMGPRSRMVYVNDLSGDIDGLFATVHAILSPTLDIRAIVATGTGELGQTAPAAATNARKMLELMGQTGRIPVFEGCSSKLAKADVPLRSPGVQAIIDEAMRTDSKLPLYVAVGGGLTEVASALMIAPQIANRFTLVWIGGEPIPGPGGAEYNYMIDPLAAQHVFSQTSVPMWQVSSAMYRTCMVSATELEARVANCGAIGSWLYGKMLEMSGQLRRIGVNTGETWTLGDSPLVLLTALNDWVPNDWRTRRFDKTSSSLYDLVPAPRINSDGSYTPRADGRTIRAYRSIDTRMMFEDFYAKLALNYR